MYLLYFRPWNKKIHPLYKCMTNGWKLVQSLLGRNEETLPAILSSYFRSILPVRRLSFYAELFLFQREISFDQISTESTYQLEQFGFYYDPYSSARLLSRNYPFFEIPELPLHFRRNDGIYLPFVFQRTAIKSWKIWNRKFIIVQEIQLNYFS